MSKVTSGLNAFRDRIRAKINLKTQNILLFLAVFGLFVIAVMIRLSPAVTEQTLLKAFDPWIQWYNAEYLSSHTLFEYFNWLDTKSWFPEGVIRGNLRPGLTFTVVIIHDIFHLFGIPVTLYDVCLYFPAFMGGLTVVAAYFLGAEILDRKMGLFAAFFLALNVGFMQRTTMGFFDNETLGVFATLMTFLFFLKALRTGKFFYSVIGGAFLGYLALSWGGYNFVFLILPIVSIIIVLAKKYNPNLLIAYAGVQGVGLTVFALSYNFHHEDLFGSLEFGGILLFTVLLLVFHLIYTKRTDHPRFYSGLLNFIKWGLIPAILVVAVIIWVAPDLIPFGFGTRLQSILSPLIRDTLNIVASVAEHMPSAWSTFYYNTLLSLMLIPLGIFFCFKRLNGADILLIVFTLLIFYFTGSMVRIVLLFAPAAALMGAYGLTSVLKIFGSFYSEKQTRSRKRKRQVKQAVGKSETIAVYILVGIICIAPIVHASNVSITQLSSSQMRPAGTFNDWEESLSWMKNNLDGSTVVVSWWDYGYWITPAGNMTTVNDNATINQTRIGMTGMGLMQTDEIYSAEVLRHLHADYVLVFFGFLYDPLGGDEGKWPWMVRIANDNYAKYKSWGFERDNWAQNSVFDESSLYNASSGRVEKKWFESMLIQLMFFGVSTEAFAGTSPQTLEEWYRASIHQRTDDDGDPWAASIPTNGFYDFDVFKPVHFSPGGMVKLFQVDYTALESSFTLSEPQVFDNGYGQVLIENTGTRDLNITDVFVNGLSFGDRFAMSRGADTFKLNASENDVIWIDMSEQIPGFSVNDVANITVQAESVGLEDKPYIFTVSTDSFFVKEPNKGSIRINKAQSNVLQINETAADVYLEIENTGSTVEVLKSVYINETENKFASAEFLSGSSILMPGDKTTVYLPDAPASFYPVRTGQKIGIDTFNGLRDELLISSNYENFKISMIADSRIVSPELAITTDSVFRNHVPVNLMATHAYTFDNDTTILNLKLKNTGEIILGLDSIYLKQSGTWTSVSFTPTNLNPGQEKYARGWLKRVKISS